MTSGLLSYGDSKTLQQNGAGYNQGGIWQSIIDPGPCRSRFVVQSPTGPMGEMAHGNHTVAELKADIDADILGTQGTPTKILMNVGVKEMLSMPAAADWKADLAYIVDAFHTKWPSATVYIMSPWRQGYDTEADTEATWIDDVQATRAWLLDGPDERVWMKGSDNGATMSYDGLHYQAAGVAECARQWRIVLGL